MGDSNKRRAWMLACCLLLLSASVSSQKIKHKRWSPATFPNPQQDIGLCGRSVKSSICDPDRILDEQAANMVDGLINEIAEGAAPYKKAPCGDQGLQGFQVAVALMYRMAHEKHADKAATAKAFARSLHDSWGVGNPACQNGVVLLMSIADRQVFISTGRGVKALVSDSQLSVVLDNIRPALKHQRYADAVLEAIQQIGQLLSGETPEPPGVDEDDGWGIFMFFCAIVSAVIGWSWLSNRKQKARFQRCADKLEAIKQDQAAIRSRHYAATSCPICLEDFDSPVPASTGSTAAPAGTSQSAIADAAGSSQSAAKELHREDEHEDGTAEPSAPLLGGRSRTDGGAGSSSSSSVPQAAAAAGGISRSSSSISKGKAQPARKPLVLRCGHAFCDPCISQWLKSHTNCPICRKDIEDNEEPEPEPAPVSCGSSMAAVPQDVLQQQVWLPELGFRLRRLRAMYPDFVTDPMIYAWEEDIAAGRALNTGVVQQFESQNPARQRQLEHSGRSGASHSAYFGGGSSGGGGGAGGSWQQEWATPDLEQQLEQSGPSDESHTAHHDFRGGSADGGGGAGGSW